MTFDKESIRSVLRRHDHIRIALVFGSAATGQATSESDIDIGVAGENPLSTGQKLSLIEDLALATGRPVDLVDLHDSGPVILTQILTKGVFLIKEDTTLYAELLKRMWYGNADVLPMVDIILRARRERLMSG